MGKNAVFIRGRGLSQLQLLKVRRFCPLFWTQFFGAFNDNFLKNALVILITFKATQIFGIPANEMVPVAGGIFILPFFLFSATAGQLADKYDKTKIIHIIKLVEIGIMLLASIGFLTGHYVLLFIVLFLMGLHSTFFGPIKYSILPQHLSSAELVGGNALIEAGTFLAILLGTIAGGVSISLGDSGPAIVSVGLLLCAVIGWVASLSIPKAPPSGPDIQVEWNPIPPTWKIYQLTKKNRTVYLSVLGISWFWFFGAAVLSLFPPYCKDVLHTDETVVTLFLATFSVGIGIGSMLCEKFSRQRLELGLVPLGSIGISLFTADLFFIGSPRMNTANVWEFLAHSSGIHILVDLLLLSVFSGFFIVPLYTLIQERSDPAFRSRIIAGNNILNAFFMVISSLLILAMMHFGVSIPKMFLVLALLNAAVAIYIYLLLPEFLLRFIIWIITNIMYRLKVVGEKNIPESGGAVLVCNHISFVDWMILSAAVKRPIRFIMDHSYFRGFLIKRLMIRGKVIPIAGYKENPELLKAAFDKAAEELSNGELVCIFPEGRITKDGAMNVFKPGIEKILERTPVPVVPMALYGLWGSFFSREGGRAIFKMPKRCWSRLEVRIGAPVEAKSASAENLFGKVKGLYEESESENL